MKFAIATVAFWEALGYDTANWRKSNDGNQAITELKYAEILGVNLAENTEVKIYFGDSPELLGLLESAAWHRDGKNGPFDSYNLLEQLAEVDTRLTTAMANVTELVADAEETLTEFDVALQNGIVATNIAAELQNLETTYSPRLLSAEQQLEQAATKVALAVEKARIDNLSTMAEGSTTGDAELIDGRVGADAVTYPNIGGAIRGQINTLKSDFNQLAKQFDNLITDNFSNPANWNAVRYSPSFAENEVTLTATNVANPAEVASMRYGAKISKFVSGHSYYCSAEVYCEDSAGLAKIYIGSEFTATKRFEKGEWTLVNGIATPSSNAELGFYFTKIYGNNVGDILKIKNPICIDITDISLNNTDIPLIKYITKGMYKEQYNYTDSTLKEYALNKNNLTIASSDSVFAEFADVVTSGENDQVVINDIISDGGVNSIYFAPDSTFNISGEIKLKSNLSIKSHGATFTTPLAITATNTSLVSVGENFIKVGFAKAKSFIVGMFIEIVSADLKNEAYYITDIDYPNGNLYIGGVFKNAYAVGSTITNVSSCFGGLNVKDVVIDGVIVDWNYPSNAIAYNTFWAQNGIHFDNSSYCVIKNCTIKNGGRHGILFCDTNYSKILDCTLINWGEHCIDVYNRNYQNPPKNYDIINNCICLGAGMCGIQLHTGSGTTVSNCICNGNGRHGISMLQNGYGNIVHDCICDNNAFYGLYCNRGIHDVNICNCQFSNNVKDGVQLDTGCYGITVNGCEFLNNGGKSLMIYGSSKCLVTNNMFKGSSQPVFVAVQNASTKNMISNNVFEKGAGNGVRGVNEASTDCDYTIVSNNMMIDLTTTTSFNSGGHSVDSGNHLV